MIDAPSSTFFSAAPHWEWLIVFYIFFGGLAGGCYFLASVIELVGRPADRALSRIGYLTTFWSLVICGILLLCDLRRPERFWHLLIEDHTLKPMFKYWSPMSIGSWALIAFGAFAFLSFVAVLADSGRIPWPVARRLRPPGVIGTVIAIVGALCGLYIAGYTGVLLAVTNRPIWADTPLIGMLLLISAVSISAATLMLLAPAQRALRGIAGLHRLDTWLIVLEFFILIALVVSLGPVARAWLNGWGLLLLGVIIIGMSFPFVLYRRADRLGTHAAPAAAVLVIVGGFVLRALLLFSAQGAQV